ncbi:aminotransferase [Mesorhizobium loti]|nr:phosphotransferase [Mesorhizobium loti]PLP56629.1 aminotransferase [Mesorhizobium loti]
MAGEPIVPRFSPRDAERLAFDLFAVSGSARILTSERDQNFRLIVADGPSFILKIANAAEDRQALASQNALLLHLAEVASELPVPRLIKAVDGAAMPQVAGEGGHMHSARLLTCLPGEAAAARPRGIAFRRQLGGVAARLDRALASFNWRVPDQGLIWDLKHTTLLRPLLDHFEVRPRRLLAERALDLFEAIVTPRLDRLPVQAIHNDLNGNNLLVDPAQPDAVSGIIDFGDAVRSARVFEVAVAAAHQTFGQADPIAAAADVTGGYFEMERPTEDEAIALPVLILARLAVRMGIIASRRLTHPDNTHFDPSVDASVWRTMEIIANSDLSAVTAQLLGR